MSIFGIAVLFDRAGGSLNEQMRDAIANVNVNDQHALSIIQEIRRRWDECDTHDKVQGDDMLEYDSFYNGFMAPYFTSYRCSDTRKAVQALDMDKDGQIDWNEFCVYLKWALNEYPDSEDADEVLDIAFRKGLIPAMREEILKNSRGSIISC